ncbi:hypothetical protein BDD12DRAFT_674917, partial [Trichophaea hybrida]
MDPLSIAASVAGLLTVAGKLSSVLYGLIMAGHDASQAISRVSAEIRAMSPIFLQVQDFVLNGEDEARRSMISLRDLVTTLTGCVLVFSELEKHISEVEKSPGIMWAKKEPEIKVLMEDLQRHKLSLNLMLSIIHHSSAEAASSLRKLHSVVQDILESNRTISTQLRTLMARQDPTVGSRLDETASVVSSIRNSSSTATQRPIKYAFETILRRSKVYKHKRLWSISATSLGTSAMKCTRSTTFSELILAEVSNISVIELPIWPGDVWNAEHY